jgi:peptidoglycan glycosyltransferase
MKKISSRAVVTTLIAALVLVGLGVFVVQYFLEAREWVTYPGSPHVYSSGNISTGSVRDRDGVMVLTNGSSRVYAEDEMVRKATLHLLGDRNGNIEAPLINTYAEYLLDYNTVTGIYNSSETGNILNLTLSTDACVTALEDLGERRGTVGVYNYKTGEILCMVSSGTYDPDNAPSQETIESYDYYNGVYLNRFTSATYVPGSIFKLVTAAAAIDNISDVSSRTFRCERQTIIDGEYITCEEYHGDISFGTGLVKSCNIVFGELAVELGADVMTKYAQAAGITSRLTFDGTTTAAGSFDLTGANQASLAWSGIGQYTDLINPCQFMTFVGSIANGGVAASPYVVGSVETPEGISVYQAKQTMLDRTMSASTAATLTQMMRDDVVNNYGTYNFPDVYVCAKSGTAEVEGQNPNAMFAGFVQDSDYPLAFIVVVEDAGSGSAVCASIAGDVLEACMRSMDQN